MNEVYDSLMRNACFMSAVAEQAKCISSLIQSKKLSEMEGEIIESILQEKLSALVETSSCIQHSIAFDFTLPSEYKNINADSLAKRLKQALETQGITQGELAQKARSTQIFISKLVTGEIISPKESYIRLLATALNVSYDWLHNGSGEMHSANFLAKYNEA
ncbi:hypothetical protein A3Q29_11125 [Providencia stuartii]|uniref:HTH cro/C1-type domain-containing protein n=1 Tax=Providencia stuartii TaxID=588 RepID=A0A1S1HKL2_PROST|nr:hypothetical protein A3Q29_11125 [Providencia stuartii]